MKAFRKVVLLTVVLCLYGFFSCVNGSFADDSKDSEKKEWMHTITITDGHVEDGNGRTVTEARVGDCLVIVPNLQGGSYVKEWYVNGKKDVWENCFYMPDCDVTIEAVWEKQTPLVLDLTAGAKLDFSSIDTIEDTASYIGKCLGIDIQDARISDAVPDYGIDVDGDGTKDLFVHYTLSRGGLEIYVLRKEGGSIRGDYVLSDLSNLPNWPITLRFGNDTPADSYSLNVTDGYATKQGKPDEIITSARPGEEIELVYPWNKDNALVSWESDEISDIMSYCFAYRDRDHSNYSFPMPSSNLTVRPVTEKKKPYVLTFTNGVAEVPYDVAVCAAESTGYLYNIDYTARLDLDGDSTEDILYYDGKFYVLSSTCSVKGEITPAGLNGGLYWPITFQIGNYQTEYTISVSGGHAEDENGNVISKSASGERIKLVRDKEEGTYFKSWSSNCGVVSDYMNFECYMPAQDVTFTAETTTSQKEFTVDLTETDFWPNEEEDVLIKNILQAFENEHGKKAFVYEDYDFDLDGNGDVVFWNSLSIENGRFIYYLSRYGRYKYSLGTSFSLHVNDGQIGTLNIIVDNEKTLYPVIDKSNGTYRIIVSNGKAYEIIDEHYNTSIEPITEAYPGTRIMIVPKEFYYISYIGWKKEDLVTTFNFRNDGPADRVFTMPPHDVVITTLYNGEVPDEPEPTLTPTPRPTATPTVRPTATPTATPVQSLTITPEEDNTKPQPTSSQMASEPGEDSVHPFTLLIAGLVLCMIGVGIFAVISLKRMKDKSDTPE